jgi:hypothetical protein
MNVVANNSFIMTKGIWKLHALHLKKIQRRNGGGCENLVGRFMNGE